MAETMKYCVSCKACRRECPTGVDMAKMKIEVSHAMVKRYGLSLHDRLVAWLPRYAPFARLLAPLLNARNWLPGAARLGEAVAGFSARRPLPRWRFGAFRGKGPFGPVGGREVVLFADTFNASFEPENVRAAIRVLTAGGYRVHIARGRGRPLCCGRTFLSAGLVEQARAEAGRMLDALAPHVAAGRPVIGLEPSCLFTLKDEFKSMLPGEAVDALAGQAVLLEEFLVAESRAKRLKITFKPLARPVLLHGHCHQKSFAAMGAVEGALKLIPDAEVETVQSSCCGMAGAFGYGKDTYDVSMAMGELSLLPAVRAAGDATLIAADGFSCRHQIHDGAGREARHVARILEAALDTTAHPKE